MKKFYIINSAHPCTELILDTDQLRQYLNSNDYSETDSLETADIVIITSCAFNQQYEKDALTSLEIVKKRKKNNAIIILSGCLSEINPDVIKDEKDLLLLPPAKMKDIEKFLPGQTEIRDFVPHSVSVEAYKNNPLFIKGIKLKKLIEKLNRFFPVPLPDFLDTVPMDNWYFIRAATGCLGNCSYCAVKKARGNVKSVPVDNILRQINEGVRKGFREISFAGDDLGCYGVDLGITLPDLLNEILRLKGDFKINIRFMEPFWLIKYMEELENIFNSGRLNSFCVPLQSGSQRVLKLMNRNYRISDAVAAINHIVESTRVKSISSIVMVGFPTETREDYIKTYELINRCEAAVYQPLIYEGRPDTKSEELDDKIPEKIKIIRQQRFMKKMKLRRFLKLPESISEKSVSRQFGEII